MSMQSSQRCAHCVDAGTSVLLRQGNCMHICKKLTRGDRRGGRQQSRQRLPPLYNAGCKHQGRALSSVNMPAACNNSGTKGKSCMLALPPGGGGRHMVQGHRRARRVRDQGTLGQPATGASCTRRNSHQHNPGSPPNR